MTRLPQREARRWARLLAMTGEASAGTYVGLVKHVPAIRWLWLGAAVSSFGDAVQGVALIWLVTRTSSAGLNIAVVAVCLYLPAGAG